MATERTLSIIKPDGLEKGIIGKILTRFEEKALKPVAMRMQHLSAKGTYCVDDMAQWAVDCAEPPDPPKPTASATARGTYPAGHVGLALEVMRHGDSWFHGGRIAFMLSGGTMPHVESAMQTDDESYYAFGLTLSAAVGEGAE